MNLENFLNPFFIYNFLGCGVYFLIFWRVNLFLKKGLGATIEFVKYFGNTFLLYAFYFLIMIFSRIVFNFFPQLLGIFHWMSDLFLYFAFAYSTLALVLLISPQLFFSFRKIIYFTILPLTFVSLFFYMLPTTRHLIYSDWGVILASGIPNWVNYLPFLLWTLIFLSMGVCFLLKSFKLADKFAKRRAFVMGIAVLAFTLGYPFFRLLYFFKLSTLSPIFSFLFVVIGFYLLSSTSCLIGIYSILIKNREKIKVEKNINK